ncbi:hypothetical protein SAMN05216497_11738 [Clostridium cochlearium]|uniref:Uncharacterized protein n=2 Tax=Clostridium cochlearium TaxID=1494 RepID=A0ABY0QMS7_CLOCO|nr:hypothetical protein [Clostridium cochlearium]SDL29825.1 hypothetical protein SAMN05216497_11738 [Clostridium cochlearium]
MKEEIENLLQKLESKMQEYDELEKILDKNGVNEINFTDKDARFEPSDLKKCEENQIICYVSKPSFYNC